jgi:hypothetical protein
MPSSYTILGDAETNQEHKFIGPREAAKQAVLTAFS